MEQVGAFGVLGDQVEIIGAAVLLVEDKTQDEFAFVERAEVEVVSDERQGG